MLLQLIQRRGRYKCASFNFRSTAMAHGVSPCVGLDNKFVVYSSVDVLAASKI